MTKYFKVIYEGTSDEQLVTLYSSNSLRANAICEASAIRNGGVVVEVLKHEYVRLERENIKPKFFMLKKYTIDTNEAKYCVNAFNDFHAKFKAYRYYKKSRNTNYKKFKSRIISITRTSI